eukprot:6177210-Pleurochrysis_carterae.AAC.1
MKRGYTNDDCGFAVRRLRPTSCIVLRLDDRVGLDESSLLRPQQPGSLVLFESGIGSAVRPTLRQGVDEALELAGVGSLEDGRVAPGQLATVLAVATRCASERHRRSPAGRCARAPLVQTSGQRWVRGDPQSGRGGSEAGWPSVSAPRSAQRG